MFGLGVWELVLIIALLVLLFGASRIPRIGRGLGEGIRNFKTSVRSSAEEEESPEALPEGDERRPGDRG